MFQKCRSRPPLASFTTAISTLLFWLCFLNHLFIPIFLLIHSSTLAGIYLNSYQTVNTSLGVNCHNLTHCQPPDPTPSATPTAAAARWDPRSGPWVPSWNGDWAVWSHPAPAGTPDPHCTFRSDPRPPYSSHSCLSNIVSYNSHSEPGRGYSKKIFF